MTEATRDPILVVGGGIAGVSAALELAEAGAKVLLVERSHSLGGRALRNYQYFPKHCPPSCGMELNVRRLEKNPRVRVLTDTQVARATPSGKGWSVTLTRAPAFVDDRCTACGDCSKVCPVKLEDPYNLDMTEVAAVRLEHPQAWPKKFLLDRAACPQDCTACVKVCPVGAIDLGATERLETAMVSAVIVATGWEPYPLERLTDLGGGLYPDVIANVGLERLASPSGPTAGNIVRPSDGVPPRRVAFVQCAGSRDVNHLAYCSGVCCMASLKQAQYVHQQLPEAEITIYYIDRRTPGRNEGLLTRALQTSGIKLVKGKVGKLEKGPSGGFVLRVEDVESGALLRAEADLVVLATGMVPNVRETPLPFGLKRDPDGFALDSPGARVFVAGVTRRPEDVAASVRDATGAAAMALAASLRE